MSEPAAVLTGPEVAASALPLSERTRRILERRQKTARIKRRGWLVHRLLLVADLVGLTVAFAVAELLFGQSAGAGNELRPTSELLFFIATLPAWIVVAKLLELYDHDEERADHTTIDDLTGVFQLVTTGTWLFIAGAWLTGLAEPNFAKLITFWAAAIVLVTTGRGIARVLSRRSLAFVQNAVIVGAGHVGQLVARKLVQHPEYGVNVVGFVDAHPRERREDLDDVPLLGAPEQLPAIVELLDVERVVVAFSNESHEETLRLVGMLKRMDLQIDIVPRLYEAVGPNVNVHTVESLPLVGLPAAKLFPFSRALKRSVDIVGASLGLLLTAPLFALVAWRIKRDSPGPVFFRQTRLGYDMREFTALKFRTMHVDVDQDEHRRYIERTMSADATPEGNGLYKLERGQLGHAGRPLAAQDQPRRAAAADQRAQGRHVARRAAAVPRLRDRVLPASPLRAVQRSGRHHRPLAGDCPGPFDVRRGARHGRRLRAQLVARARPLAAAEDALPRPAREGDRVSAAQTIRVGVVGLGYWGPNLVRNLHELDGAEVTWVCDLREDQLDKIQRRYPAVRITADYDDLLQDDSLDAVAVATPVGTHHPLALKALAGREARLRRETAGRVLHRGALADRRGRGARARPDAGAHVPVQPAGEHDP